MTAKQDLQVLVTQMQQAVTIDILSKMEADLNGDFVMSKKDHNKLERMTQKGYSELTKTEKTAVNSDVSFIESWVEEHKVAEVAPVGKPPVRSYKRQLKDTGMV